jgi:hypothetical protein
MATGTTSSASYGICCVQFTIPEGTPYYDATIASKVFGGSLNNLLKTHLGRRVPFIHAYSGDWHVVHNVALVQKVRLNMKANLGQRFYGAVMAEFYQHLSEMPKYIEGKVDGAKLELWKHTSGYVYSLYNLMYYLDPVSMVRAINVRADDPWQVFEPENFGPFHEGRGKLMKRVLIEKDSMGIIQGIMFAGRNDPKPWAKKMKDEVLPYVYQQFSGTNIRYRTYAIRAGGDETNKTFSATGIEADTLAANAILETHCNPKKGKDGYLCYYYYPGANAWQQAKAMLSKDLIEKLEADPVGAEAEKLTREVVEELLLKQLATLPGKYVGGTTPLQTSRPPGSVPGESFKYSTFIHMCMIKLVSVHPCMDFNGRSTRGFSQLASVAAGFPPPIMALYDFDITFPSGTIMSFMAKSTQAYEEIQQDILRITIEAQEKGERVSVKEHFKDIRNGWMNLFQAFKELGAVPPEKWDPRFDRLIEKRLWFEMMDLMTGPKWVTTKASESKKFKDEDEIDPNGGSVAQN